MRLAQLLRHEEDFLIEQPIEVASAFLPTGEAVFRRIKGTTDELLLTPLLQAAIRRRDVTVTHNHPGGRSFSLYDLEFAVKNDLGEIRAVGRTVDGDCLYRLVRPAGGHWPRWADAEDAFWESLEAERAPILIRRNAGEFTEDEFFLVLQHRTFRRLSRVLGVRYLRTQR